MEAYKSGIFSSISQCIGFKMIKLLKKINSRFLIKKRTLGVVKKIFLKVFALAKPNWWSTMVAGDLQDLRYEHSGKTACQYVSNNPLLLWRAETLYTKEPETIDWIDSLPKNDVLFDIGANVGMYTIYAGVKGMKVYSFEPESSNYGILNRNIIYNKISENVKAYCLAVGEKESIDVLKLTNTLPGSAHTTFGDNEAYKQVVDPTVFTQGCFCTSVDQLVYKYGLPFPQHIKIDVDGIESQIVKGAAKVIEDKRLKSILIELNEDMAEDKWIKSFLLEKGFKVHVQSSGAIALRDKMQLRDYVFVRSLEL